LIVRGLLFSAASSCGETDNTLCYDPSRHVGVAYVEVFNEAADLHHRVRLLCFVVVMREETPGRPQ